MPEVELSIKQGLVAASAAAPLLALHAPVVSRLMLCVGVTTTRCPAPPARPTVHRPRGSIFSSIRPLSGLLFLSPSHAHPSPSTGYSESAICSLIALRFGGNSTSQSQFDPGSIFLPLFSYQSTWLLPCCIFFNAYCLAAFFFLPAIPPAPFGWILRLLQCP